MGILDSFFGGSDREVKQEPKSSDAMPNVERQGNNYPMAVSASLDRAYLRPLQTPLWDVEVYDPACKMNKVAFFYREVGELMLMANEADAIAVHRGQPARVKTEQDTCLHQSGMLDYPIEFSVLGFKFFIEPGASAEDVNKIITGGVLRFGFSGAREYLEIPLEALQYPMHGLPPEKLASDFERARQILADPKFCDNEADAERTDNERTNRQQESTLRFEGAMEFARQFLGMEPYHRFNIGRTALRIKPGEKFHMSLVWNQPPETSRPLRLTVMIVGLMWKPL